MNFFFLVAKTKFYSLAALVRKILFCHSKIKFISSRHRVISSIYNFTFYNKRLEQGADRFGPGMERLAVSRLHLWYRQLYFFEMNLTGCLLRNRGHTYSQLSLA